MPVPDAIKAVKRPKNTIVIAYGKNKDRYAVRKRIGCRYVNGRNLPVNGPVIGHIINGEYVPCDDISNVSERRQRPDLLDWADVILSDALFKDMIKELKDVYSQRDAMKIYCISILRVIFPGIKDYELKDAYNTSYLSVLYPNVALSKNTVCTFFNDLGRAVSVIQKFMKKRAEAVNIDHHLLVDGTLKSDESIVNSLSDFSRKAKTKGTRDISVIYAFDLEKMEPVCSKCFPGNMLDMTAYETFISDCGITKGLMIGDKGFPSSAAKEQFEKNPDLHYLNPLKRNSKYIKEYQLDTYDNVISSNDHDILCKKAKTNKGKFLYAFRDRKKAAAEEAGYIANARKKSKNGNFDNEEYEKKRKQFGTVILESDLDMDISVAYKAYSYRWQIEIVMRFYKSACKFDETREQDDYSVIGSEFCDFLSTVLTFRLLNKFDEMKIMEKYTYKETMKKLKRAKKVRINNEWELVKINPATEKILTDLDILPKEQPILPKRKRGRPRKNV